MIGHQRLEPGLKMRMKSEARRIAEQHRRLVVLRDEVTTELSRLSLGAAGDAFARFAEALEAHFTVEERLYFPAIQSLDPELWDAVESLLSSHRRLRRRVADLLDHFASGNGFACAILLKALIDELRAHEREEEQVMTRAGGPPTAGG